MLKVFLFPYFLRIYSPHYLVNMNHARRVLEKKMQFKNILLLSLLLLGNSSFVYAEQSGITLDMHYIGENVTNIKGGLEKRSTYLGTGDMAVTIDTEQTGWWQGGTWFIEALVNHGTDPSSFIGDAQTVSNIADGKRARLQQFWYQHEINDNISILLGLHDLNSEFYVSEYGSLFLNSSFGVGPDMSGNVPTSLWPEAGYAVRLDVHDEHLYLHVAAYDGDPATRAIDMNTEGLMLIAETGYLQSASAYKLGVWQHTADKVAPDGAVYSSDFGMYAVVDQAVNDDLGVFLQLGLTPSSRNDISNYAGFGVHVHGLIPSRHDDTFGIAVARAGFSSLAQNTNNLTSAETTVEITYDMPMTDYLTIHPALQWVQHPSGDKALSAAKVAMLRLELHLP
jgi:porin